MTNEQLALLFEHITMIAGITNRTTNDVTLALYNDGIINKDILARLGIEHSSIF